MASTAFNPYQPDPAVLPQDSRRGNAAKQAPRTLSQPLGALSRSPERTQGTLA